MSNLNEATRSQLRQLIETIERMEQDKKAIAEDIAEKYLEAKSVGFDVKAIRTVISMRKRSKTEREKADSILKVYMGALDMLSDTPLGQYAIGKFELVGADA